jgi:hypothetical protein
MTGIIKRRHAFIPACITGGPAMLGRMGGTIDGRPGMVVAVLGTLLLMAGLLMMFQLTIRLVELVEGAVHSPPGKESSEGKPGKRPR